MPNFRRWFEPGGMFFFTVVTYQRLPLFATPSARQLLGDILREVREESPFDTIAVVLLPDHLHCLWALPRGDSGFSERWNRIKGRFTERWIASGHDEAEISHSQRDRRSRGIWQPRFWEHVIRDEIDLEQHFDYIHYNPVKHGHTTAPGFWP